MRIPYGYVTTKQVADRLGWNLDSLQCRIREGEFPAVKHGRRWIVAIADLQAAVVGQAGLPEVDLAVHATRRIAALEDSIVELRKLVAGPSTPEARTRQRTIRLEFELNHGQRKRKTISKRVRWLILERDNHRCVYCGVTAMEAKLTIDHKLAFADGGTNDPDNLVTACAECNDGKADRPLMAPLPDRV